MRLRAVCRLCHETSQPFEANKRGGAWAWWIKHRLEGCTAGGPAQTEPTLEPCP